MTRLDMRRHSRQVSGVVTASVRQNPGFSGFPPTELELIQAHMTQKPVLWVGVGARALRVLIKKMRLDGKGKCGCARHSCVGVDLWRASQGGMGM
jgi:hypothetical protein